MRIFHEYLVLLLIWLVSFILFRTIFSKTRTHRHLPPSPRALPIIGHLHLLGRIPHQALHKLSIRHGPLIHLYFGSKPCVVVSSPEMARECLKTHEMSFLNRPKMTNVDYLTYGSADFVMAPYGPYWKFMKKLCMSELLGGRILDQNLPIRQEEIERFLHVMLKKAYKGEQVDVGGELVRLTNNIISRMAFNRRCSVDDEEAHEVREVLEEMCELAGRFNFSDMFWFCKNLDLQGYAKRLKNVRDRYDKIMGRIIEEHEEARRRKKNNSSKGGNAVNLLDILLDIYEDQSSEIQFTRENIKGFIMNMFGAGTDTSSVTIEWALSELINRPNVMARAREEIDSIVGTNRLVTESDIANLPYLQAIVKETLRLHPTGPMIARESTEHCTVNGYDIPANTRLFVNVWAINRDPKHWEEPLEFMPERFWKSTLDMRGQNFQFLPFGSGRRSCPGTSLALQVVHVTLAAVIQCFDWKVGDGASGNDVRVEMEEGPGISLPRAKPLVCVPSVRLRLFSSV
ncbi:cytochrome P450 93A2-like [Argentina anserina]|uniref:cytochrome P450 93A2-like n=1 Tax=Argentina anserina TaxID=57926 RepID=UPI002176260E|nr:cytochrome P450 93A2-like [Potentilla anserina]